MNLYRKEDRFDSKTGKKLEPKWVVCGAICDFTGIVGEYVEEIGISYVLDYNSIDPCGGCGIGEHEFAKKWKIEIHDFLFGAPYIFKDNEEDEDGRTIMEQMLETAKKEGFERMYFDQLFRWCRIRTADRLLTEGKYTKEELGMVSADWMDDEDDD